MQKTSSRSAVKLSIPTNLQLEHTWALGYPEFSSRFHPLRSKSLNRLGELQSLPGKWADPHSQLQIETKWPFGCSQSLPLIPSFVASAKHLTSLAKRLVRAKHGQEARMNDENWTDWQEVSPCLIMASMLGGRWPYQKRSQPPQRRLVHWHFGSLGSSRAPQLVAENLRLQRCHKCTTIHSTRWQVISTLIWTRQDMTNQEVPEDWSPTVDTNHQLPGFCRKKAR